MKTYKQLNLLFGKGKWMIRIQKNKGGNFFNESLSCVIWVAMVEDLYIYQTDNR